MIQIRQSVFETNSSSTHAVAILTEDEYKAWKRGETVVSRYGEFTPVEKVEELQEKAKEKAIAEIKKDWNDPTCYNYHYYRNRFTNLDDCIAHELENDFDEELYDYDQEYISTETTSREINGVTVYAVSVEGSEC